LHLNISISAKINFKFLTSNYMKHLFLSLLLSTTMFATATAQQGFNYQAAIQKQDGATLQNQEVTLRISLIGQSSNTVYYSETQNSTTNNFGIVSLVIGQGEALSGNFTDIPWESETILISIELKVDNNFVSMGTSPIMAVPYALHATNAVTGTGTAGKIAVWSGDSQLTDVKSFNVNPNVEVISDSTAGDNDPIFEVKNKLGQVVFGVYQAGVRINVDDTNNAKAGKGGFAIGGLSSYKNNDNKFFRVTPDSVRVLLRENQGKAGKGGFAIGGLSSGKEVTQDLFFIDRDSARIYISTDSTKAGKGGFAIGGLSSGKGLPVKNIFVATVDSTKIYVSEETGDGSSGRFTVGGRSTAKGEGKNYFDINTSTVPDTITNQNRVLWYPQKNAFMAGRLYVLSVDSVGENSFSSGYESQAQGDYSQALGYKAVASGTNSTAIGNEAKSTNTNSFALGEKAFAGGIESYAFGRGAKATGQRSFAFGSAAPAGSDGQYAWGEAGAPEATGDFSFAIGNGTKAEGKGSIAMGFKSVASNNFALAMGAANEASGWWSTTMGSTNKASGTWSIAMGAGNKSSGEASTAMGRETTASGDFSTAMGYATQANKKTSTAMGRETTASGENSTVMGYQNTASGEASTAMGRNNIASGQISTAIGYQTTASGQFSTAMGISIKAAKEGSFGIGLSYNSTPPVINTLNTMAIMGGYVGINTVNPGNWRLKVDGIAGGTQAWLLDSDKRLKTNIKPLEDALQSVLKLQGVTFNWKDETNHRPGRNVGFIAQEVKEVLPEIVNGGGKDEQGNEIYYSIEYATLTPVLVEAIKELNAENKSLNEMNKEQNETIEELKGAIKEQKELIDKLFEELKTVNEQLKTK
jgi:uncharacterized coiled-coil protein SlyX